MTRKSIPYGKHTLTLETGEIARQAGGAVLVNLDDTVVLVTVVAAKQAKPGQDFFPLTVDYQEKTYAAGRIPGGFFRREGRPSEKETLTCRLIDRPIRPLFPEGFYNEVQVIATVMSVDPEIDPDIPALIGASAAIGLSGIPFDGPIGAARVGYIDGQYVLNPTKIELTISKLELVVAGTEAAVLMVEGRPARLWNPAMVSQAAAATHGAASGKDVVAPMHGTILDVLVEPGDEVEEGQPIAILEAMKMETTLTAPTSGRIAELNAEKGAVVESGEVVASIG